ncbi:MAG: hypothetical protein KBF56_08010, partial [Gemmatimonadaceae bacterium]|nr:hypothetical protein [Gemmatimonadaceae bacterium]
YCEVDQFTSANPAPEFGAVIEHVNRHWLEAAWVLRHENGDPSDLHGELLLNAQIRIDTQDYIPISDIVGAFVWKGEAKIAPSTGLVRVDGGFLLDELEYTLVTADPVLTGIVQAIVSTLVDFDPAAEINGTLRGAQTQRVSATPESCDPAAFPSESSCRQSRSELSLAINAGVIALRAQYGVDILSDADLTTMLTATVAPGVIPSRWSCEQARAPELPEGLPPAPPTYQCELIVPAKRLNYLADGVDVVFFDDIEPSNPAFAMWVAIQGLKAFPATAEAGRTAEANLCTTAIPRGQDTGFGGFPRPFALAKVPACFHCEEDEPSCEP